MTEVAAYIGWRVLLATVGAGATVLVATVCGAHWMFWVVWLIWLVLTFGGVLIFDTDWLDS